MINEYSFGDYRFDIKSHFLMPIDKICHHYVDYWGIKF